MKTFFDPSRILGRARRARDARPNPLASGPEQLEGRALLAALPTHTAFASILSHSAEYDTNFVIRPDYQKFLGRSPAPSEVSYYLNEIQTQGASDERLLAGFSGSDEFYQSSGGTPDSWIKAMYQNILNRQPSASEVGYYQTYLADGGARNGVAFGFAYSTEHEGQVVTYDYGKYLNRVPTAAELNAGVKFLQGGQGNENLIANLVGSTEFNIAHDQGDANFVRAAYVTILGRTPSAAELSYNVGYLEGTGPVNVPGSGAYNVTVIGSVNGGPTFTRQGIAGVVQLGPLGDPTPNPEDFGIELGDPLTAGPAGSLYFASDRALFSVLSNSSNPMPLLLANTTLNAGAGTFSATVATSVVNTGTQQNVFNLVTNGANAVYLVNQGKVVLQFTDGGASFVGTIRLAGHLSGSPNVVTYTATVSGNLV